MHLPGPLGNHAGHDDRDLRPAPQVRGCGPASTIQLSGGHTPAVVDVPSEDAGTGRIPAPRATAPLVHAVCTAIPPCMGGWAANALSPATHGLARPGCSVSLRMGTPGRALLSRCRTLDPPTSKIGIRSNPTGPVASWGTPEGNHDLPTRPRLNGRPGRPGPFSDGSGA